MPKQNVPKQKPISISYKASIINFLFCCCCAVSNAFHCWCVDQAHNEVTRFKDKCVVCCYGGVVCCPMVVLCPTKSPKTAAPNDGRPPRALVLQNLSDWSRSEVGRNILFLISYIFCQILPTTWGPQFKAHGHFDPPGVVFTARGLEKSKINDSIGGPSNSCCFP